MFVREVEVGNLEVQSFNSAEASLMSFVYQEKGVFKPTVES